MNPKEIPTPILQAELNRRNEEAAGKVRAAKQEQCEVWLSQIDTILAFYPKHGRTSCSDEQPYNQDRCNRCTLLEMKANGHWDSDYRLEINLFRNY